MQSTHGRAYSTRPGPEALTLQYILKLKIKPNDCLFNVYLNKHVGHFLLLHIN